eukprot:7389712-Alexandrium_andersonii.AAC.1
MAALVAIGSAALRTPAAGVAGAGAATRCSGPPPPGSSSSLAGPRRRLHRTRHPALPLPRGLRGRGSHDAGRPRQLRLQ